MLRRLVFTGVICVVLCVGLALVAQGRTPRAQGTGYQLARQAVVSGGGDGSVGGWIVSGAAGQPSTASMSAGGWSLTEGFWAMGQPTSQRVMLPALFKH